MVDLQAAGIWLRAVKISESPTPHGLEDRRLILWQLTEFYQPTS
jgi:hypothetical protein